MFRQQFQKKLPADFDFTSLGLPLSRSTGISPIPLCKCTVSGFKYFDGLRCIPTIHPGDRLDLFREQDNPHDEKAIAIHAPRDGKLGFLPRYLNEIPAALLDCAKRLHAVVNSTDTFAPSLEMLEVTVVMS